MKVIRHWSELQREGRSVVLVPTMGALHAGHASLIRQAGQFADLVVVSVFVNPTQFGPNEDFSRYPRDLDRDMATVESAGGAVVYAPAVETMYPRSIMTQVVVPEVTVQYEGAHRPGHFEGVATVVLKLFNQIRPDVAVFARKDLQQCAVIGRMVADLDVPVRIELIDTVREPDGLAMSSRNVYLSPEERAVAPVLYQTLQATRDALLAGRSPEETLNQGRQTLTQAGFAIDYYDLADTADLVATDRAEAGSSVIVAARLGKTRLIDNIAL